MQALVLGTAQFGFGYGVTNTKGRLSDAELSQVMHEAQAQGIRRLDTAAGYGDAQERLRPWAADSVITTKVAGAEPSLIVERVLDCLRTLGVDSVDSCLLHDWHALGADVQVEAAQALGRARDEGLVREIGVSAYEEADLASALDAFDRIGIVQVPMNAVDRRLEGSTSMAALVSSGARIQVRSVFLQGLLATPASGPLGEHPCVMTYHEWCRSRGRRPMEVALAHVRALTEVSEVVVGVTSAVECSELAATWESLTPALAPEELACADVSLLDPRTWAGKSRSVRLPQ